MTLIARDSLSYTLLYSIITTETIQQGAHSPYSRSLVPPSKATKGIRDLNSYHETYRALLVHQLVYHLCKLRREPGLWPAIFIVSTSISSSLACSSWPLPVWVCCCSHCLHSPHCEAVIRY